LFDGRLSNLDYFTTGEGVQIREPRIDTDGIYLDGLRIDMSKRFEGEDVAPDHIAAIKALLGK
jgi:hypothetical protein